MRIIACLSAACLSISLFASPLFAVEPAELIPSSAAGVIRLKAPEDSVEAIADLVDDIKPGFGQLVHGQAGMLGVGISNPTMKGADRSKDFWAAIFLKKDEDPAVVFIIPATNVEKMKSAIDESFEFVAHEGYGIYSEDKAAVDIVRKHLANPRAESIGDIASKKMTSFVSNADISAALNLMIIKEVYKDELAEGKEEFLEGIKKAQSEMLEVPGVNLDWVPGLMDTFGKKLFTAVEDAQAYAVSVSAAKTGLNLQEYLEFEKESESSGFLAKHPPEALDLIKRLPADQLMYGAFGGIGDSDMTQWGLSLLPKMLDLSDEEKKEWEEIAAKAKKIKMGTTGVCFTLGDMETGLIRVASLGKVAPKETVRELAISTSEVMSKMELPGGAKQEMTYTKDHEKVDEISIDLMTTKQIAGDDQLGGFQAQINQFMYGGDSMETRIAYLEGVQVQAVGGGTNSMKAVLKAYKENAAAADRVIMRDLKPLGEKNNFAGLIDVPTLVVTVMKLAASSPLLPPMPFDEDSLDNLDVERSYLGFAFETTATGCQGKLHIPKQTLKSAAALAEFFQEMQNQVAF